MTAQDAEATVAALIACEGRDFVANQKYKKGRFAKCCMSLENERNALGERLYSNAYLVALCDDHIAGEQVVKPFPVLKACDYLHRRGLFDVDGDPPQDFLPAEGGHPERRGRVEAWAAARHLLHQWRLQAFGKDQMDTAEAHMACAAQFVRTVRTVCMAQPWLNASWSA